MNGFTQLILLLSNSTRLKLLLLLFLCWAVFYLLCYLFGGVGLYTLGKRKRAKPRMMAWVPMAQIDYELRLARGRENERRVTFLLWWWMALSALGLTSSIWAIVAYLYGLAAVSKLLLAVALAFFLVGLAFYIWIRVLEFYALKYLFRKHSKYWTISLCGTILGIPLQRLFLYVLRKEHI